MMFDEVPVVASGERNTQLIYKALLITAAIAAVFCLVVLGLLINNLVQARWYDPLTSSQMTTLKANLATDPANEQLRQQVRDLDQYMRWRYFTARYVAVVGLYILLGGAIVLLLSLHFIGELRSKLPMPVGPPNPRLAWVQEAVSRRAIIVAGVVLLAGMLTLAVLSRHDAAASYAQADQATNVDVVSQTFGNQPPDPMAQPPGMPNDMPGAVTPGMPIVGEPPPPMPPPSMSMPPPPPMSMGPPAFPSSSGSSTRRSRRSRPAPAVKPAAPAKAGVIGKAGLEKADASDVKVEGGATAEDLTKNWASFRGPLAGVGKAGSYPASWDGAAGKNLLWKTPLPLSAPNSPIYWNGKLFMSGATKDKREVYAVDAATGKLLWKQPVKAATGEELPDVMDDTGYAAPTMATDGKHVFAMFADGNVAAFDMEGKPIWTKNLGKPENNYGHASSLAVYKNLLLIQFDQGHSADDGLSDLIALNTADGKNVYRTARPVPACWASPLIVNTGQRDEVILAGDPFVISYDPATGTELWRADALSGEIAPSPCYANGMVYVSQEGAGVKAIKVPNSAEGKTAQVAWTADDGAPDTVSPVTDGNVLILVNSGGMVTCYHAKEGRKLWEKDLGTPCSSSPIIVEKAVYLTDDQGVTHIFEAGEKFKALGSGKIGEKVAATPVFIDGKIYLRGAKTLFAIGTK
ncbi:MAG: outer membrane protein assembly factor BamB family protein [Armatimonadota bacterium]